MGSKLPQCRLVLTQRQRQRGTLHGAIELLTDTGKPSQQRMRETRIPAASAGVDVHDQTLDPTTDNNPNKTRASEPGNGSRDHLTAGRLRHPRIATTLYPSTTRREGLSQRDGKGVVRRVAGDTPWCRVLFGQSSISVRAARRTSAYVRNNVLVSRRKEKT
ncbi:hypothetical protein GCM10023317_90340 [Actinopolymorpha pittospori]